MLTMAQEKKTKRRQFVSAFVVAILFLALVIGAFVYLEVTFSKFPASNAKLANSGYLKVPSLPSQDSGYSKLFLVSANASYGVYNGEKCFIINATLRNDYSAQEHPPDGLSGYNSSGNVFFILWAKLFSNNKQISANEITAPNAMPVHGSPQHSLEAGETGWFEMYMASSAQNIDTFTIDLVAFGGLPIP